MSVCLSVCAADTLDARHAGVGVALFNAVGAAVGGFLGPFVVGAIVQRTGSFVSSMVVMGGFLCWAGVMMAGLGLYIRWARHKGKELPAGCQNPADDVAGALDPLSGVDKRPDAAAAADVEEAVPQDLPNPRATSTFKV